jgi:hypothetical protein
MRQVLERVYWATPSLGYWALQWRRRFFLVAVILAVLVSALGGDPSPAFAECDDGSGSLGPC